MSIRHWIGEHLRYLADHIDNEHAFRSTGFRLTFERGVGAVMHTDGSPGLQLWYRGHEYDEAHR